MTGRMKVSSKEIGHRVQNSFEKEDIIRFFSRGDVQVVTSSRVRPGVWARIVHFHLERSPINKIMLHVSWMKKCDSKTEC